VAVISSITVTFGGGLGIGGPAVLVWSWIGTSFFTVLVSLSMAEICSTYPTAGSVYHWAGMLANQSLAPSLCYVTGWFNFIGNAAGDASFAYGFSSLLAALLSYNLDDGIFIYNYIII
jgi:amino acid transporter